MTRDETDPNDRVLIVIDECTPRDVLEAIVKALCGHSAQVVPGRRRPNGELIENG